MKIAIIEDEKLAAERLSELLLEIDPTLVIDTKLESVADSIEWLTSHSTDLIFMDIQLTDGLSFEIFDHIEVESPIIFTTAYDQYAIRAFKVNSIDYLLKPIRKDELQKSLQKFRKQRSTVQMDIGQLLSSLREEKRSFKERFLVQYGERFKNIDTADVAFFYAMEKCTFLTTNDRQTFAIDLSLDKLQEVLNPRDFFRINRKLIIHYRAIKGMAAFSRSRLKIELNPAPPKNIDALVSVERAPDFRAWMDQ